MKSHRRGPRHASVRDSSTDVDAHGGAGPGCAHAWTIDRGGSSDIGQRHHRTAAAGCSVDTSSCSHGNFIVGDRRRTPGNKYLLPAGNCLHPNIFRAWQPSEPLMNFSHPSHRRVPVGGRRARQLRRAVGWGRSVSGVEFDRHGGRAGDPGDWLPDLPRPIRPRSSARHLTRRRELGSKT